MAFRFKRNQSVPRAVQRLGRKRLEQALAGLRDRDRAAAIHGARKEIKKVRALLRLVRHRMARKDFHRLTRILREAASRLATPRDAYIQVQALQDLAARFRGQLAPGSFRGIRAARRRNLAAETRRFAKKKNADRVARALRRARKAFSITKVKGGGWKAIGPGLKSTYRQGRRAARMAMREPAPENFHTWRKRTQDLWYQVRLLRPIWPEQLEAMAGELKTLGKLLGDDHDLVVLTQDRDDRLLNPREWEALAGLIAQRQHELRAEALALGARFYAEKPAVFCTRLARYWKSWRRGKRILVASVDPAGK